MKLFYSLLLTTLLWCSFGFSQCADNISLTTQEQIDAFPVTYSGCTAFSGQLSISGGAGNLNGLSQITTVGSLVINNVPNLANYAGLNHLTTITGDLSIYGQTPPIINSFSALTSIGGTLSVGNCSDLTQLPSFGALASLGGVNLTNNSILANIASLSTVTNLNAGTIYLHDNTSLTSLSGLENINPTSISNITVNYNYQLATCNQASICSYIALGGTTNFFSNAVGCNTFTDVISACNPSCPAGDVYLSSQAEVDAFIIAHPSCTALNGSLTIAGADITNLNGLSNITSVLGDFIVAYNSQLTSLAGLNALTTVKGSLNIYQNTALTSLSGLNALITIKGNLNISQNAALASLNGLNSWSSIPTNSINISNNAVLTTLSGLSGATALSDIAINGNNSLISISGLANLVTVSSIGIANNPALISLTGLNGITTTSNIYITSNDSLTNLNGLNGLSNAGSISISNNASLQSLNGLNSLTSVTNSFDISSNSLLTNLAGLNSLTIVGSAYNSYYNNYYNRLTISNNPLLNNLSGLNSITTLYFLDLNNNATLANVAALSNLTFLQYLNVVSNPLLTSLTGLNNVNPTSMAYITLKSSTALATCNVNSICTFLSNGGAHDISGNATGCNTNLEVQIACGATTQCPAGTLVFNSQAQLNTFAATYPTCTAVAGSVFISGADITNLNAFSHISSIGGGLTIQDNPLLTSLTGLNALLNVGDITGSAVIISGNPVLTNLSAFSSLANVKDLIITNNAALTSISGLSNLVAAYSIGITNNALLTSLNGLNGLTSTNSISITNNPLLVDLSGLNGITTIFYSINISSNVLLTSLNGLNNLTAITYYYSSIFITDNPVLTSLSALNNLNPANIYSSISLYYNPLLSVCNVPIICTFLANGGFANIYNNATGCNTTDEVQIACGNSATPTFTAVSPTSLTVCEAEATEITLTGLVPNSTSKVNYTINTDNYTVYLNSNVAGTAVFNINLNNAQNGQTLTITSVERIDVHTGILTVSTNNTVSLNIGTSVTYYADNDGDGYGGDYIYLSAGLVYSCSGPPVGYVTNNLDCYDSDPTVHPGSVEISCNGIDDDCNGLIDANDPGMVSPQRWFADADEDGYGNALVASTACTKPLGYVGNNTDCDDTNSLIHPNQTWYTDNDGDHYGIGAFVTQCARPLHGYLATELTATTGDCNDNDASTSPGTQRLVFSGAPKFTTAVCSPLLGTLHTNFSFEVTYFDTNNNLPAVTFPRVYLDYEGNNIFNDENDRVVIMTASDVNDLNTVDGKKYIGTINSLPNGTNWQTSIQILNGSCVTATGPFNYPDVVVEPNLEIFANDIIFSTIHPTVSAPLTVNAVIHNVSDYPARNFYAHLVNQYDPSIVYADILVANVAPQSSTTVSWNITTPNVPAWCPMQVILDYTNVITETNELNNSAVRPFINGNYNLIGGIAVTGEASPSVSYIFPNDYIGVSGHGEYFGTPVPLLDPSVAGATLTFKIIETGATYSTYTDSQGNYSYLFPAPSIPGVYHIQGELTDYTFIGNFSTSFTRLMGCGTDLASGVSLTTNTVLDKNLVGNNTIIEGESVSGEFSVGNSCTPIGINTLLSINQSGGTPAIQDVTVPPLASNGSFHTSFNNIVFNTPGSYSICSTADGSNLVNEDIEYNNSYCQYINVLPNKPDIYPLQGPNYTDIVCHSGNLGFVIYNAGGAATGAFTCDIIVRKDGVVINTLHQTVTNIVPLGYYSFSKSITYSSVGIYSFEIQCDVPMPNGVVNEVDETNNIANYDVNVFACQPNLSLAGCESFDVQPVNPQFPGTVNYVATILNSGNATATGPIAVRFHLSGGQNYDTQYNGNLASGASAEVTVTAPSVASATQTLTAIADYTNTIVEGSEDDNEITNSLCWDFEPIDRDPYYCGPDFWETTKVVNKPVTLSVGINQYNLYDASTVAVKFEVSGPGLSGTVNLGHALLNNVEQNCGCPYMATLPYSFVFPQTGDYTVTMTADADNFYTECDESNNVLVRIVHVTNLPDMRILSQFINPSLLNPDPGTPIHLDVTYENLGNSNLAATMALKVLVDEVPLDTVFPISGIGYGEKATVSIPALWSSNLVGPHIVRAIIDSNAQVIESNEINNEATRAIVVGEAANLKFQILASSNPSPALNSQININATIQNNGDLNCDGDVVFYYVNNQQQEIEIGSIHVSVPKNSTLPITLPWTVLDDSTIILAKIINASVLEFTYDDNQASITLPDTGDTEPIITQQPTNFSMCSTVGVTSSVSVATSVSSPTYTWQYRKVTATITNPAWTVIKGTNAGAVYSNYNSNTLDITKTSTLPAVGTEYRVIITNVNAVSLTSNTAKLNVIGATKAGTIASSPTVPTVCAGSTITFFLSANVGTSIQWQSASVLGTTPNWANIDGANGAIYTTDVLSTTSKKYYRAVVSNTCTGITATTAAKTIRVNPEAIAGTITGGGIVCSSGTGTQKFTMKLTGNVGRVQWQYSNTTTAWTNVLTGSAAMPFVASSFTSASTAISTTYIIYNITGDTSFRAVITSGVCTKTAISDNVIYILAPAQAGSLVSNATRTLCPGTGTSVTLSDYVGNIKWMKSINYGTLGASATWAPVRGTYATLNTGNLLVTTWYKAIVSLGTLCTSESNIVAVDVYSKGISKSITANITSPTGSTALTALCASNVSKILTIGAGYSGDIQWETYVTSATTPVAPTTSTIWTIIIGGTTPSYTITNASAGKNYFRAKFTVAGCASTAVYSTFIVYYNPCRIAEVITAPNPAKLSFDVIASPNPYNENFNLSLSTSSEENVGISVYDMIGRLLEQRDVRPSEVDALQIGNGYPTGVYNIVVNQGTEVKTLRVVKQ